MIYRPKWIYCKEMICKLYITGSQMKSKNNLEYNSEKHPIILESKLKTVTMLKYLNH